ncbi:MAG: F0F1 ATP synthase subunit A [Rickettsiales bacterium]|jgi:F-type H+-transporting ATPase subunit a|nr:F0F1 ATP synthase subunit A [Rickettsiales bacterium]
MNISTDENILFQKGFVVINGTLVYSWIVMFVLMVVACVVRWKLVKSVKDVKKISTIQIFFETMVSAVDTQLREISSRGVETVFPFIATLFLYIIVSNLISLVPAMESPTGSLSTTLALALAMFIFSLAFGLREKGMGYFGKYFKPVPVMLPLNIFSDVSKIVSMSIRLYGNVMSASVILLIMSKITFLSMGFPILLNVLGIITGCIQAYIFSVLSMLSIAVDD